MREVSKQPKEGQYVAIWVHEGTIFCDTYRWREGDLETYNSYTDIWEVSTDRPSTDKRTYFIV